MSPMKIHEFISYASLFLIIFYLELFTNLTFRAKLSIAIISVFLILFLYIFKTRGPILLKILIIASVYLFIPIFLLIYLGTLNSLPNILKGIVLISVSLLGLLSAFIIIKLSYAHVKIS